MWGEVVRTILGSGLICARSDDGPVRQRFADRRGGRRAESNDLES